MEREVARKTATAGATVAEVVKLALPNGTVLVGGAAGLEREVVWARLLAAESLSVEQVQPGELALVAFAPQNVRHASLSEALSQLARAGAVAAAIVGDVPPGATALADLVGMPLLCMPTNTRLAEVERSVIALLVNRRAELEQRGIQIYRRLVQQALDGRGIPAIAESLVEITGNTAVIEIPEGQVQACASPPGETLDREELEQALRRDEPSRSWLDGHPLVSTSPPIVRRPLGLPHWSRFAAPIIVRGAVAGIISIVGRDDNLDEIDRVATGRAASASAVEMAKRLAISEAENRIRGDFLDDLFNGRFSSADAVIARAAPLGYDLTRQHAVVIFELDASDAYLEWLSQHDERALQELRQSFAAGLAEELNRECPGLPLRLRAESASALIPLDGAIATLEDVKSLAEQVRGQVTAHLRGVTLSAAIGRLYRDPVDLARAHREAEQTLTVALRLFGGNRTTAFEDLGIYGLLFHLQGTPELKSFYEETLARLVEHDREHGSELVPTLRAFFATHGNLSRTAEQLYLHRNTVAYRIERIEQLTGLRLDDEDDRFRLQLALRLKDIV